MKQNILFMIILVTGAACSQRDCATFNESYIPTDLDEALVYLNCTWSDKNKLEFKKEKENDATTSLHFGTGLSIRNGWGLWKGENSIVKYFNSIGIFHPDDMSSIILTSFHRQLNNKEIDLNGQVKRYVEYWKKVKGEENKWKEENMEKFETFKIGDLVKMNFSLQFEQGKDRVYLGSNNLNFDENGNCVVTGIVRDKQIEDINYTLVVEVTDICNRKEVQYGADGKLIVGKTFEYNITFHNIQHL